MYCLHLTPAQHLTGIQYLPLSSQESYKTSIYILMSWRRHRKLKSLSQSPKVTCWPSSVSCNAQVPTCYPVLPSEMLTIRKWFQTAFQRVTVMVGVLNVNWIMLLGCMQSLGRSERLWALMLVVWEGRREKCLSVPVECVLVILAGWMYLFFSGLRMTVFGCEVFIVF